MKTFCRLSLLFCTLVLVACQGNLEDAEKKTVVIQAPYTHGVSEVDTDGLPTKRALVSITPKPYIEFELTKSTTSGFSPRFGFKDEVLFDVGSFELSLSREMAARGFDAEIYFENLRFEYAFISDMAGVYIHVFIFSGVQRIAGSAYNRIDEDYRYRRVDTSGRSILSKIIFDLLLDAADK